MLKKKTVVLDEISCWLASDMAVVVPWLHRNCKRTDGSFWKISQPPRLWTDLSVRKNMKTACLIGTL